MRASPFSTLASRATPANVGSVIFSVGAHDIAGAGGIASEEAFGLPTVAPYVEPVVELHPKYLGGDKRAMIVYKRDPSCVKAIIEEAFDFRKLIEDDTGWRRTCTYVYGTLIYYRPYSCNRVEWLIS